MRAVLYRRNYDDGFDVVKSVDGGRERVAQTIRTWRRLYGIRGTSFSLADYGIGTEKDLFDLVRARPCSSLKGGK